MSVSQQLPSLVRSFFFFMCASVLNLLPLDSTSRLRPSQRTNIMTNLPPLPVAGGSAPTIRRPWLSALSSINLSSFPESLPSDRGYILPDPNSFIEQAQKNVRTPLLYRYLQLRPTLIQRLGVVASAIPIAVPIPGRIWRQVLSINQTDLGSILVPSSSTQTKTAADRYRAAVFLSSSIEATKATTNVTLGTILGSTPVFRGMEVSLEALSDATLAKEVLWELAELNFRLELGTLNHHLHQQPAPVVTPPDLLDCVCSASAPHALLVVDIQEARRGLASDNPLERLPQLIKLKELFQTWKTTRLTLTPTDNQPVSPADAAALESKLINFYTQQFFEHFGRYPIVPRSLA
jgi:hypothetical protein